ncbi:apolipoprotein N-acyltransferase [Methylocystis bryophila]|uniref:Apolipoprotein N-acyltransferase n=1 Tax=Methylocystis bryophila TaxID=655015 RepID=A0A1W6MRH6_9HYPH|nr:apolipoprotein N-acyltransferase [Methylocystis bryophila]ARN80172.1 apolipoprotein N-acyltransferase [Methylocystis bryophila]BDV40114.1 apolipoprotein N-acyltransferase [Methylocystis bryophila]
MNETLERLRPAPKLLSWPHRVILAEGWSRRSLAFLAGASGALALEPLGFAPAMAASLILAVWLLDGCADSPADAGLAARMAPIRAAAGVGWWWGFGYFLAGLWWLGTAMLVEPDQFAWALPLAILGMPAALALFPAAGFAFARLLWSPGALRVLALAAGLGGAEWLRGHVLTGFPWNDIGMALAGALPLAQSASLFGLHGLDLVAIVIFAAPATLIEDPGEGKNWRLQPLVGVAVMALALMAFGGAMRLRAHATSFVPGTALRVVQPNLPQDAKFRPENGEAILAGYLALSDRQAGPAHGGVGDATHVFWPESAFPFVVTRKPRALAEIARRLQGSVLITGAARAEEAAGHTKLFNAIDVLEGERLVSAYDKMHLVPFGEYLPLEGLLRPFGVNHLVPGIWDVGTGPRRLSIPGLPPVAPLICYEAIFSGEAVDGRPPRPEWMLNVTNDGWFGKTSGPYQHFAQARLRAVEEGLPLVRVANTGVSAIVDPYGRILQSLPLGVEGVIDGALPEPASPTFFARYGSFVFPALWAVLLCGALYGRLRS